MTQAVASAPLIVICVLDYATSVEILDGVADLTGKTVANLSSLAPDEVTAFAEVIARRGGEFVDGSIICYPQSIGTDEGSVLYSGAPEAWARHEATLMAVGASSAYVSEMVTASCVLNLGLVGAFFTTALSAFVECATFVLKQGVDPELLAGLTPLTVDFLGRTAVDAVAEIAEGHFETREATIDTYLTGMEPALLCLEAGGIQPRVVAGALENLRQASAAGLGSLGFAAQAKVVGA
ncbi:MAG: hypothetical protein QM572_16310 [Nocardioides sp.]|uniref:imine reductase family protein n=1 Tax=Nocardioides sp. TaxID=35761 RepID=UPI0039E328AF